MRKNKSPIAKLIDFTKHHENIIGWILLAISLVVLVGSSLYVGQKSALIHTNNHDNLIDNYLFEDKETFQNAIFPAAHTFLVKWPLFALSSMLGNTENVYIFGTMALYLLTVLGFMLVIFLLTRKNTLITALIGLAFAGILMLTPAQPADGLLLPLNMAMITTRNIEFLMLFGFIYLVLTAKGIISWRFISSIATLTLLGATDKYYLMIALVAAALYIIFNYSPLNKSKQKQKLPTFLPLIAGVFSYGFANILLASINKLNITNIPGSTTTAPFSLVGSAWQMLEAIAGGIQGMAANFGADIFGKSLGSGLAPYLLNGLILIAAIYCAYLLISSRTAKSLQSTTHYKFTLWLIFTFVGSFIIFIASDHSYLVDGRYLTPVVFAGLASIALVLSVAKIKNKNTILIVTSTILLLAMPVYAHVTRKNYAQSINAMHSAIGERTQSAADIITQHDVEVFAGDYWFASPVRLKTNNAFTPVLMSTDTCDAPNTFLTSKSWYKPDDSVEVSAHYILKDADGSKDTYNHGCTMEYLDEKYGEPEVEYIIRGTFEDPIDIIRIYPYDIREKIHQ